MITLICGITPAGHDVLQEDVGIAGQAVDALLDARAARVEQADDRRPHLHGLALDLDDLGRVGPRQAAAEHREVLGEDVDDLAVDRAPAGDHPVAGHLLLGHAELHAPVLDEHVELLERALVQQQVDPLARRQLALGVLGRHPLLAAAGHAPARDDDPVPPGYAARGTLL
jgi:hypothetical protein